MFNEGQKVAIIVTLMGILMIVVGFTIGLVDKIKEERCMNTPIDDIFSDKSCKKYISKYEESEGSDSNE